MIINYCMVTKMFEHCRSNFQRKKLSNLPPKTFSVFFIGEFSPNFDLENMISTSASDFSWKEIAQICQILERKKI